jgi:hypothetical protein
MAYSVSSSHARVWINLIYPHVVTLHLLCLEKCYLLDKDFFQTKLYSTYSLHNPVLSCPFFKTTEVQYFLLLLPSPWSNSPPALPCVKVQY